MSHLDPYGDAESRGWEHPERPASLPWPDPKLEPGPWDRDSRAAAELYADPRNRSHTAPPDRSYGPPAPERDAPAVGYPGTSGRGPGASSGGPGVFGGGFGAPGALHDAGRNRQDRVSSGVNGHHDLDHEDAPTAQFAPVRDGGPDQGSPSTTQLAPVWAGADANHDDAPTAQFAPVRDAGTVHEDAPVRAADEPESDGQPEPGKRHRGRRRAGTGRSASEQKSSGRAGRNLPAAISVGVCLGAAVLLPLFLYTPAFLLVLVAAFGIGSWEMSRAVRRSGAQVPLVPLIAGGVLTVTMAWFAGPDALLLGLIVTLAGMTVWRLGDGIANLRRDLTAATLIAVYVPFLGGFAALLAASPGDGDLRVLVTLVAVVLSDTGGYAAGANFGKHPMAPTISPKKSWEGFVGSISAAALGSALLLWLLFGVAPWWGAVFGVAIAVAAVLGDLAESMLKRDLGVKDMSNLLPGHGGLMDRLDSVLFAVPTAYLLLVVFVPAVS